MTVTTNNETLARTAMVLCLGTAAVVLFTHWWIAAKKPRVIEPKQSAVVAAMPNQAMSSQLVAQQLVPQQSHSRASWQHLTQPIATTPSQTRALADTSLVVDLSDRQVFVYHGDQLARQYAIAVGQAGWETPTGDFRVELMQRNPYWKHPITGEVIPTGDRNPLGRHWIGFWSDQRTQVGFHGTNREELIGQAVSHGCLRMRNQDVEALYKQVAVGTPVIVRP